MSRRCIDPARPPQPWDPPQLRTALTNRTVLVASGDAIRQQHVFLVRDSSQDRGACHAYQRIQNRNPIPLGDNRGQVVICVAFPSVPDATELLFQEPPQENEAIIVAIKQVRKYLERDGRRIPVSASNENPYNEIAAMRYLNPHARQRHAVMGCMEALEDKEFLYIVMPYSNGGELHTHIPWARRNNVQAMGLPQHEARIVFLRILNCVDYLHQRGVCHRDLKNENIVMQSEDIAEPMQQDQERQVPLVEMSPTIIDMAMSLKLPSNDQESFKITAQGTCGTFPFMAPEVMENLDFDGYAVDVWSLGIVLFCLLTGRRLYRIPNAHDFYFKHFLLLGGLTDDELNERWQTRGANIVRRHPHHASRFHWLGSLLEKIRVVQRLDQQVRHLLQGMLYPDPTHRLTIEQIRQHVWMVEN